MHIAPRHRRPQALRNSLCSMDSIQVRLSPVESQAFDFFRRETIRQLQGGSSDLGWKTLALRVAHEELDVAHAIIALACLHRAIKCLPSSSANATRSTPAVDQAQYELALEHCNKAMSNFRTDVYTCAITDQTERRVEVILVLSLLLFSFEILHNQWDQAALHMRTGLRILYHRIQNQPQQAMHSNSHDDPAKHMVLMRATPCSNMDILIQAFVRLDADSIAGSEDGYVFPYRVL